MADVVARGVRFHGQGVGSGSQTVIFLHGLVMDNLSSWYFTVANLVARDAEIILYDLRGHGLSERPKTGYGVDDMVADLDALLTSLRVDRLVHLVGNSFGGLLAVSFAVAHPERVASLVVVDGHLSEAGWGDIMATTLSLEGEERDRRIAEAFKDWLGRHSKRKRNHLAKNSEALVYHTSLVSDMRESQPLTDAQLRHIGCPVLAIYGERSDILDHGQRIARLVPRTELRIVPGCSHSVLWEHTATLRDQVCEWIGAQAAGGG